MQIIYVNTLFQLFQRKKTFSLLIYHFIQTHRVILADWNNLSCILDGVEFWHSQSSLEIQKQEKNRLIHANHNKRTDMGYE